MRRVTGWAAGVFVGGLSIPMVVCAQERPWEWHPMWGMWGAWGIGMMLMMLVFWGLVIVGVVFAIRWLVAQGKESRADSAAQHSPGAVRAGGDRQGRV